MEIGGCFVDEFVYERDVIRWREERDWEEEKDREKWKKEKKKKKNSIGK